MNHLFFLYLVTGEPTFGYLLYRSLTRELATNPAGRKRYYVIFIVWEWALAGVVGLLALVDPAMRRQLGFGALRPESAQAIEGFLFAFVPLAILMSILMTRSAKFRASTQRSLQSVANLLPSTRQERWLFAALCISAGICEELVYRSFLFFYLGRSGPGGLPVWGVVVVASIIFGVAHLYQGVKGIALTGILGALFGGIFLFSGSIFVPMLLHALQDLRVLAMWRPHSKPSS